MKSKGGKSFFAVNLLLFFWCIRAEAARYALIDVNSAFVFEIPNPKSKILQKLPKDSIILTSNVPIGSYYKVKTSQGTIGWISAEVLIFKNQDSDIDFQKNTALDQEFISSTPESPAPSQSVDSVLNRTKFRVLGGVDLFSAGNILSAYRFNAGYQLGGELVFPIYKNLGFLIRVEKVYKSAPISILSNSDSSYLLSLGSLPAEIGLEIGILESDRFALFLAGLGGVTLQNQALLTDLISQKVSTLTDQNKAQFTGLVKVNLSWLIYKRISFFTEMGYRYLKSSTLQGSAGSVGPYLVSQPSLDFSGLILDVGLSLHF